MKKITFKGRRGQSPRREKCDSSKENDSPIPSGSGIQELNISPTCNHSNSLCHPRFCIDPCNCQQFTSEQCDCQMSVKLCQSSRESPKRKSKVGIFNTLKKKLTSSQKPCQKDGWDSSFCSSPDPCLTQCNHRDKSRGSSRKPPYRSRSAERPRSQCREQNEHSNQSKHGPKSVQLHKRQIHGTLSRKTSRSTRRSHKEHFAAAQCSYESDSDEEQPIISHSKGNKSSNSHDEHLRDIIKPFDGYGHASSPRCNDLLVPDSTRTSECQCSSKASGSSGSSRSSGESEMDDAPATLSRDPSTMRYYDQVKELDTLKEPWSLSRELLKLAKHGWYWGPITRIEAEDKLSNQPDGAFLVRDSSDERYLLSLSFRSYGRTLHTRIEHCNGVFSFYAQPESEGYYSIIQLINHSMNDSHTGVFYYSRARTPGSPSYPVKLTKPVSRFTQVRTLQYLCRFVIRQTTRVDHIENLPLPSSIRGWLQQKQY